MTTLVWFMLIVAFVPSPLNDGTKTPKIRGAVVVESAAECEKIKADKGYIRLGPLAPDEVRVCVQWPAPPKPDKYKVVVHP